MKNIKLEIQPDSLPLRYVSRKPRLAMLENKN